MLPVIALFGRPNVGKSTLFNRLTRSQKALVVDCPGVTRDRQFGQGEWEGKPFIIIDTAGINEKAEDLLEKEMLKQIEQAIIEADILFMMVDARVGLNAQDELIARYLRRESKPIYLLINKMDGLSAAAKAEFYQLGFDKVFAVAASQNQGVELLMKEVTQHFLPRVEAEPVTCPKVAVVGRPNVGKSTLVNNLVGNERVIVCDLPGTTRDSIYVPITRHDKEYMLIDTAGVRKRNKVNEVIEKFSVIKTLQSIQDAAVVLLVMDATAGITDQDLSLIQFTVEAGKGLIVVVNKWDSLPQEEKKPFEDGLTYRLRFASFAKVHFISALKGMGVNGLWGSIDKVYSSSMVQMDTSILSKLLEQAVTLHQPPLVKGRRIKLRYAHCGGHNPPTIVIHGNQVNDLPMSYQKYLSNFFIKALKLQGTPVKLICRSGENPYAGKRNVLTKRQIAKRKRMMQYVKKRG